MTSLLNLEHVIHFAWLVSSVFSNERSVQQVRRSIGINDLDVSSILGGLHLPGLETVNIYRKFIGPASQPHDLTMTIPDAVTDLALHRLSRN